MRSLLLGSLLALTPLAVGCAGDPTPSAPAAPAPIALDTVAAALGGSDAAIVFRGDWTEETNGAEVLAGGTLKVVYDPTRLTTCRSVDGTRPTWTLTAWYRLDTAAPVELRLVTGDDGLMSGALEVPASVGALTLWFENRDATGCVAWDSDFGRNYVFDVGAPTGRATATFDGDGPQHLDGDLVRGGLLEIAYDPARVAACENYHNGARAWGAYASWRFEPSGETGEAPLFGDDRFDTTVVAPLLQVPDDATAVELWFRGEDNQGCVAWDSNYGANHRLEIGGAAVAPTPGWVGGHDFVTFARVAEHHGDVPVAYYWDSWQGMPKASWVEARVWAPGLTDQRYDSLDAARQAAKALTAEVITDALSGDGPDGWGVVTPRFERQEGHDFVYSFRLGELRWSIYDYQIADGLFAYRFRFSGDGGASWLGDAANRHFAVAASETCALFPTGTAPASCPQPATVGWAGNFGAYRAHDCHWVGDLDDPARFEKSGLGHDCMVITADVWVAGVTDSGAPSSAVLAEVETDLGGPGGPLATPERIALGFDGLEGHDFRFRWNLSQLMSLADRGDYRFRFRFSADGGASWTTIGADDGGWRTLAIRDDSRDVQVCGGVSRWYSQSTVSDACLDAPPTAHADASCELWVERFARGQWSHGGTTLAWLEATLRVDPDADVVTAGMWVEGVDGGGAGFQRLSLGSESAPGTWATGFTTAHTGLGTGTFGAVEVTAFAFFVDVRDAGGAVTRFWQSGHGANYTVDGTFASPGQTQSLGSGSLELAPASAPLYESRNSCGE
ncbi:MAG: hypothetical protein EP329_00090 [Deltaproteobacteria bacterium]|nr:MAG: hypothetical protein EP329_00090 [Deltaproteobacteria bacterium]